MRLTDRINKILEYFTVQYLITVAQISAVALFSDKNKSYELSRL